jgi:predicted nucleic acid-binding protein
VEIVVDSSVLVGMLVPNDVWHDQTIQLWATIEANGHRAIVLDCVAAESISVAVRRLREKGLLVDVQSLLDSLNVHIPYDRITWILSDARRLYFEVLDMVRSSSGELNFNDALIALTCRERGIPAIASFDADFDQIPWLQRIARPEDIPPPA